LVAPLGVALLGLDQGGVDVEGVGGHRIPAEQAGGEGVPDLAEADQPSLTRLGIAHPPEPVAHRVRVGEDVVVEQREEGLFAFQLPEVFEGAATRLEQQDERVDEHRGRVAPVAPGAGQMLVGQDPQPEPVVVLGQERQAAMRGQRFVRPFELEGQHRLSYHRLTLWVKEAVIAHPLYIRSQSGPQGFSFILIAVLGWLFPL